VLSPLECSLDTVPLSAINCRASANREKFPSSATTVAAVTWGGITKTGNAHLRRVVVEAAWAYRHAPAVTKCLRQRQEKVSEEIKEIAWKAQHRLHSRYRKLTARGKNSGKVVTAMGRELLGFIWAIGVKVEAGQRKALGQAA
jgi:hypothetical protein